MKKHCNKNSKIYQFRSINTLLYLIDFYVVLCYNLYKYINYNGEL